MSQLPRGWSVATLDQIVEPDAPIIYGILQPGPIVADGIPYVRPTEIVNDAIELASLRRTSPQIAAQYKRASLKGGDVLLSIVGTIGKVALVPEELDGANITQSSCRIRVAAGVASARLTASFLRSPQARNQYDETRLGTAVPRLNLEDVRRIEMPLPPTSEQPRIVAKIDSLSAKSARARDRLDHIPRLVKKYKQAVLAAAFDGSLTEGWRNSAGTSRRMWRPSMLGEIARIGTGATPKRGMNKYYDGGKIPWITSGAVNAGFIRSAKEYITETALRETNCHVYPAGTLVMAMYGEGQTRGRVAVLGIDAATNQALAAIELGDTVIPAFVLWHLRSGYAALREQAAGGVQPNLNLGMIKAWAIDLPQVHEQQEIVRRIEAAFAWIDRLAAEATSARKLIDHLDQAVLAKAFRGELVPQDPNDEPASVLLDRIRAERAAAPAVKRGRKAKAAA